MRLEGVYNLVATEVVLVGKLGRNEVFLSVKISLFGICSSLRRAKSKAPALQNYIGHPPLRRGMPCLYNEVMRLVCVWVIVC
jgi:hypothetical protein